MPKEKTPNSPGKILPVTDGKSGETQAPAPGPKSKATNKAVAPAKARSTRKVLQSSAPSSEISEGGTNQPNPVPPEPSTFGAATAVQSLLQNGKNITIVRDTAGDVLGGIVSVKWLQRKLDKKDRKKLDIPEPGKPKRKEAKDTSAPKKELKASSEEKDTPKSKVKKSKK